MVRDAAKHLGVGDGSGKNAELVLFEIFLRSEDYVDSGVVVLIPGEIEDEVPVERVVVFEEVENLEVLNLVGGRRGDFLEDEVFEEEIGLVIKPDLVHGDQRRGSERVIRVDSETAGVSLTPLEEREVHTLVFHLKETPLRSLVPSTDHIVKKQVWLNANDKGLGFEHQSDGGGRARNLKSRSSILGVLNLEQRNLVRGSGVYYR